MALQVYGDGINSSAGENTNIHFYQKAGIKAATAINVYGQYADREHMPNKLGKTFKISKFLNIYDRKIGDTDFGTKGYLTARTVNELNDSLASSNLPEGAGDVNQVAIEKITMSGVFSRHGEMIPYTDEVDLFSNDSIQVQYHRLLGDLANQRYEDLVQRDMLGTTTVEHSGTGSSLATMGTAIASDGSEDAEWKVSYTEIQRAVKRLKRNRAKKNKSIVTGSTKVGTMPIDAAYCAIVDADVQYDLENLVRGTGYEAKFAFQTPERYAAAGKLMDGEVGSLHQVRFVAAETAAVYGGEGAAVPIGYTGDLGFTTFATDAAAIAVRGAGATAGDYFNVHNILFPTAGAFATIGLKGRNKIRFHSKAPGKVELSNPYGTKGFFSYDFFYAGIVLEAEKLLNLQVLATA